MPVRWIKSITVAVLLYGGLLGLWYAAFVLLFILQDNSGKSWAVVYSVIALGVIFPFLLGLLILPNNSRYSILFEWALIAILGVAASVFFLGFSVSFSDLYSICLSSLGVMLLGLLGSLSRREKLPSIMLSSEPILPPTNSAKEQSHDR